MAPLLLSSAARGATFASSCAASSSSTLSRHASASLLSSSSSSRRPYAAAAPQAGSDRAAPRVMRKDKVKVAKDRIFEDYQHDETTSEGHAMIQKEREALAFMRTVELELPKLKPIPYTPPNIGTDYLRFHTQKTWPLDEADPNESTTVTLSAPVIRLPLHTPAARHKFLLLTAPEYYHPFRPQAFDPYKSIRHTIRYDAPQSPVNPDRHQTGFLPPTVATKVTHKDKKTRTREKILHRAMVPRVGGWTPAGERMWEFDERWRSKLSDRKGEDADGWVSIKCALFPFQLQNKKWCEDTLRRLVNEANDPTDPMTDIPLDLTPYFEQWRRQHRRADGARLTRRHIPREWDLRLYQGQKDADTVSLESEDEVDA